jgi:hypothetical protein
VRVRRIVKLADHDGIIAFAMEGEALRAQMAEDTVQRVIDSVHRATNKWACKIEEKLGTLKIAGGADVICNLKPELDEDEMTELIAKGCRGRCACVRRACVTLARRLITLRCRRMIVGMDGDVVDFECATVDAMSYLLGSSAWERSQCIDKDWWVCVRTVNLRGNKSKVRLRFVKRGCKYFGRAVFSVLVSALAVLFRSIRF